VKVYDIYIHGKHTGTIESKQTYLITIKCKNLYKCLE
jgi:hypothetical protein